MLTRRLQILLDDERHERLVQEAGRRGVSVASLIREAIDALVPSDARVRAKALRAFLDAPDVDVPEDPAQLKREIQRARAKLP